MNGVGKLKIILLIIFFFTGSLLYSQSAGVKISFFIPESLNEGSGSVSKEEGLSTSFGLGSNLSIPVGFTYIKAAGLMGYSDMDDDGSLDQLDDEIWYVADLFIPYVHLRGHMGLGPIILECFGGVAGMWVVAPQSFDGAIGRSFGDIDNVDYYMFNELDSEFSFGYGYQIGAALGFKKDSFSLKLEGSFSDLRSSADISSSDGWIGTGGTLDSSGFSESFTARLKGFSIGLAGSYKF